MAILIQPQKPSAMVYNQFVDDPHVNEIIAQRWSRKLDIVLTVVLGFNTKRICIISHIYKISI